MKKQFKNFKDARRFVHSLGLESAKKWEKYAKSGNKPKDVPANPSRVYKEKGWISWGNWLGTGTIANNKITFREFTQAREFVIKLGISEQTEWRKYCKSGKKPDDIPADPNQVYKNKGWRGYGDWLRAGKKIEHESHFMEFNQARELVIQLGISGSKEWRNYCKSGKNPDNIPATPNQVYKNKGWKGMGDWLGTGAIHPRDRKYWSFEKTREFIRELNLKGQTDWAEFCKSGKKPQDIPSHPHIIYKKDWKGWGDWLGTGTIATQNRAYRSFESAREFVHSLGLESANKWRDYKNSDQMPKDIPAKPEHVYKKEWLSWADWLGTKTIATNKMIFREYEDAQKFIHSLAIKSQKKWNEFCKSNKFPKDIPVSPERTYKNKGWEGWGDWLGTGTIATINREYRSFSEAKKFIHSLGLKDSKEWREYLKSGQKPDDIPSTPEVVYSKKNIFKRKKK